MFSVCLDPFDVFCIVLVVAVMAVAVLPRLQLLPGLLLAVLHVARCMLHVAGGGRGGSLS